MTDPVTLQAKLDCAHQRIRELTAELESLRTATHPRCYFCASRPSCSNSCPRRPSGASCGAMPSADSIGYPR